MAPAEIWQCGKRINLINGGNKHEGKLNGQTVIIEDISETSPFFGCMIYTSVPEGRRFSEAMKIGDSKTLDGGEIVRSIKKV